MENKTIKRLLTALTVILMAIGVVVASISVYHGDRPDTDKEKAQLGIIAFNKTYDPDGDGKIEGDIDKTVEEFEKEEVIRVNTNIDNAAKTSIGWAIILTCMTWGIWIIMMIFGVIKNSKGLGKMLITFGVFVLILVCCWFASASTEVPIDLADNLTKNNVDYDLGGYNLASWGIATSIVLIAIALFAWVAGGIYSLIKK